MREFARTNHAVGLAAVFVKGSESFSAEFGTVDGGTVPFTARTRLPVGTLSKTVTAWWLLRQQDAGRLRASDALPGTSVSYAELLAESSGMQSDVLNGAETFGCPPPRLSMAELRSYLDSRTPGEVRRSNLAYEAAAEFAAAASSRSFETSVLGELEESGLRGFDWLDCRRGSIPGFASGRRFEPLYSRDRSAEGMTADAETLAAYARALMADEAGPSKPLLRPDSRARLFENQIPPGIESWGTRLGFGWSLNGLGRIDGEGLVWHAANLFPYQALVAMAPSHRSALVLVSNTQEASRGLFRFVRRVFESLTGFEVRPDLPPAEPPADLAEWAGDYVGLNDELVRVESAGERLRAELFGRTLDVERKGDRLVAHLVVLFGLLKFQLPEITVDAVRTPGRSALIVKGWAAPLVLERLGPPKPLPAAWSRALGEYRLAGEIPPEPFAPKSLALALEDGRLVARVELRTSPVRALSRIDSPLSILSDSVAVTAQHGTRLELREGGVVYSGFRFVRSAED